MCFRPSSTMSSGEIECPRCGIKNPVIADECKGCGVKSSDFAPVPGAPKPPTAPKSPTAPKAPIAPKLLNN